MKTTMKVLSVLLTAVMLLGVVTSAPFAAGAAETKEPAATAKVRQEAVGATADSAAPVGAKSGTTGDCTWQLDDDGTLTVSGNGRMADYYLDSDIVDVGFDNGGNFSSRGSESVGYSDYYSSAPWQIYLIKKIIIEEGVTHIGNYSFWDASSLKDISIADSVTS